MGWIPCTTCCGNKPCADGADCCTDALPNSLDFTFPSGWAEPTIDSGKCGCAGISADQCAAAFDSQTFNLSQDILPPTHYTYSGGVFCTASAPPYVNVLTDLLIEATFVCQGSGLCRIVSQMTITIESGPLPWVEIGRSVYLWHTADFTLGGETCSGLSKTGVWQSLTNTGCADSEGLCAPPSGSKDITIADGG